MIHKETNLQENFKVVISLLGRQFNGVEDIDSALGAIGYAAKQHLRLRENVTGTGVILGNVMILDVNVPLSTTFSHDVMAREDEFNAAVVDYLMNGKLHVGSGVTLGGFGRLNVGFVESEPRRQATVTLNIETNAPTSLDLTEILADALRARGITVL